MIKTQIFALLVVVVAVIVLGRWLLQSPKARQRNAPRPRPPQQIPSADTDPYSSALSRANGLNGRRRDRELEDFDDKRLGGRRWP